MQRGAQPGNKNGVKGKIWSEALKRALARYSGSTVDAGLDRLADRMVKAAADGDEAAFDRITEKIGDRLEGKPHQSIEAAVEHSGGFTVSILPIDSEL